MGDSRRPGGEDIVHVLLADLPRDLTETLAAALSHRPGMRVSGGFADPMALLLAAARDEADVVIVGSRDGAAPGIVTHLVGELPGLHVFIVAVTTGSVYRYRLRPDLIDLGRLSPEGLADAIRAAVDSDPA